MNFNVIGQSAVSKAKIKEILKDNEDFLTAYHESVYVGLRHVKVFSWLPVRSANGQWFIGNFYMQISTNGRGDHMSFSYFKSWKDVENSWLGA